MEATAKSVIETDQALIIYRTLIPELETPVTDRTEIDLQIIDDRLVLKVDASDLISLRSTMNTWLRLIQVAYEVLQHITEEQPSLEKH